MNDKPTLTGSALQPICGIYEIRNTVTGQCYIGQSKNIPSRWANHFTDLGRGRHSLLVLQSDWDRYGPDAFRASVVKIVDDEASLLAEEAAIALEYLNSGTRLYNATISGWFNEEEGAAHTERRRAEWAEEQGFLRRKRRIGNESGDYRGGDRGDEGVIQTEGRLQGGGAVFGNSPGASLESDQPGLREPEIGLCAGEQGVGSEARSERPTPASLDKDGQREDGYRDAKEALPVFDRDAAEVLTRHLPDEEKEAYLQELMADFLLVGGNAQRIALLIQAALSKEDGRLIRETLDPEVFTFYFNSDDEAAAFDLVTATYPGGIAAYIVDMARYHLERSR